MSQSLGTISANKQIFRALLSLASAALLIRVMGVFYQVIVTARFGAGATMDAYFVAFALPYLLAQLIMNATEYSVVPVYARVRSQGNKEQASVLFSTLLNLLLIGGTLLIVGVFIFRRQIVFFSAPALDTFRTGLAVDLTPFILPIIVLMIVIGFLEYILNVEGQFGWPAYAGLLVPLTTAVFVLVAGKTYGVVTLCIGMVVGLCLQLCLIIIRVKRTKLVYRPVLNLRAPEIGLIMTAAGPALLGVLITQASPLVDQIFASLLSPGSISALNYSLKFVSVFSSVLFGTVGQALFPHFSRQASTENLHGFRETLRLYLWAVVIGTIVLACFVLVLAHPLVQILFQRGAFTADDTNHTAVTLIGFTVGLAPMAFGFVASRALSALRKNHLLVYIGLFSVIANAIFDYIFARIWQIQGIALATSAVYFCTMLILLFMLRRTLGKLHLFTPPREMQMALLHVTRKLGQYHLRWIRWGEENLSSFSISHSLRQQIIRIVVIMPVFAVGIAGVFLNAFYTLRIALGSVFILILLRYRYALLLAWVLFIVLKDAYPIFQGNNLLTGLIVPTLLLMAYMPIKQTFKRMPALAFLLIYLLWVFVSIGISTIGIGVFLTKWTIFLAYVAVGVLAINTLTTQRRTLLLIDVMLLSATFVALHGIYSYITRQNGVSDPGVGFRIYSIFGSSPSLALFLSLVIPLALYRTLTSRGFKRISYSTLILILLVALGLTFTRSAFISVPLSIIIMVPFLPSRKLKVGLFIGILALAPLTMLLATVSNVPIFSRFFSEDIATLNGRTIVWQALIDRVDPMQLLGNGLQASDILLTNLRIGQGNRVITDAPHSIFVGAFYDHGFIGLTLLVLVLIALFVSLIAGIRKARGDHRMLFATALAAFVCMFLQSLISSDFWIETFAIYFWVIMALPFALCWSVSKQLPETSEDAPNDEESRVLCIPTKPRIERVTTV